MEEPVVLITDDKGARGSLEAPPRPDAREIPVRLESGQWVRVDARRLIPVEEGTYRYEGVFPKPEGRPSSHVVEEHRIPLAEEEVHVRRETRETGRVRIAKKVHEHVESIDEPVYEDRVEVHRVAVDRVIDAPVPIRQEGDTTIIPVLEERVVVQKQLVLKEELHVTKRRVETRVTQEITRRSEEVEVEREERDPSARDTGTPPEARG